MKLNKNVQIEATYQGVNTSTGFFKKYKGYDHLFTDVTVTGGCYCLYGQSRAKTIPDINIPVGSKVRIIANWKSSIITSIKSIKIIG